MSKFIHIPMSPPRGGVPRCGDDPNPAGAEQVWDQPPSITCLTAPANCLSEKGLGRK